MSAATTPSPARTAAGRLLPIDALRGLIMMVMALDHANYFIAKQHTTGEFWGGPIPHYDTALGFITRFLTHFAAPGFFFLMGASMVLMASGRAAHGWTPARVRTYFLKRGALLLVLQQLVENPGWAIGTPGAGVFPLYFGVLYGLGGCMIVGSLLLQLPSAWLAALGVGCILLTQGAMPAPGLFHVPLPAWQHLLMVPGTTPTIMVYYPLLPWLGTTLLGFLAGRAFSRDVSGTYRRLVWFGLASIAVAACVRLLGGYGNVRPAEDMGWMALLNLTKYPPSLVFTLFFLGVDLVVLGLLAKAGEGLKRWGKLWLVYGQSALFFYLVHLYLYGVIGLIVAPKGTSLARMYPFWLLGLAILYPLCRWYGAFKQRQPAESFWRFL